MDQASRVAVAAAREFLLANGAPPLVRFVLFSGGASGAFSAAFDEGPA